MRNDNPLQGIKLALVMGLSLVLSACAATPAVPSPEVTLPVVSETSLPAATASPASPTPPAAGQPADTQPSAATSPAPSQPAAGSPAATQTFVLVDTPREAIVTLPPSSPAPQDSYLAGLVDQITQDLASRLKTPEDEIQFVKFEPVIWPDGSLGCPQPGMAYTQVQVDGYRISLEVKGRIYNYHGGGSRPPFLCETSK